METLLTLISVFIGLATIITELINIFNDNHKLYVISNILILISVTSTIFFGVISNNLIGSIGISVLFFLGIICVRGINKGIHHLTKILVHQKNNQSMNDSHTLSKNNYDNDITEKKSLKPSDDRKIYAPPFVHEMKGKLYNYIVLDIETTGLSKINDGITQISAIKFKDDKEIDRLDQLLNPQKEIPENIQYLTHITNDMVKDKPTFSEFNDKISNFIGQYPIVGHNINFDINFLIQNHINLKDIFFQDTLPLSQIKLPYLKDHKLITLKKYFGIYNVSHNAINDCETTAVVYRHLRDNDLESVNSSSKPNQFHEFDGLRFCITGQFIEMTRDEIKEFINIHGGKVTGSVSGLTDYLIKGKQIANNLTDGTHSSSELKAMELSKNNGKIKIIGLNDLYQMIGGK